GVSSLPLARSRSVSPTELALSAGERLCDSSWLPLVRQLWFFTYQPRKEAWDLPERREDVIRLGVLALDHRRKECRDVPKEDRLDACSSPCLYVCERISNEEGGGEVDSVLFCCSEQQPGLRLPAIAVYSVLRDDCVGMMEAVILPVQGGS